MNHLIPVNIGDKYKCWTVLQRLDLNPKGQYRYLCKCKCGDESIKTGTHLRHKNKMFMCPACRMEEQFKVHENIGKIIGFTKIIKFERNRKSRGSHFLVECTLCNKQRIAKLECIKKGYGMCRSCMLRIKNESLIPYKRNK